MQNTKRLCIWMDHNSAQIMELKNYSILSNTINSNNIKGDMPLNGVDESLQQNTEQGQIDNYYKSLSTLIKGFEEVLLFGPTEAKTELFNLLKNDSHFNDIKIEVETTDYLTVNQMHAFAREYYKKK